MRYDPKHPPPDPEHWSLIRSKDGIYYRRKPGKAGRYVAPNQNIAAHAALTKQSSPAAAKLRRALAPYLAGLNSGRVTVRLSALIRQGLKEGRWPDYSLLRDFDFQPGYPFGALLKVLPRVERTEDYVTLRIPIPHGGAVKIVKSNLVTVYGFTLVLVAGNPVGDGELTVTAAKSKLYPVGKEAKECMLRLPLPTEDGMPWLLLLRVTGYEGDEEAYHGRHSGMAVVGWE